MFVIKKIISAFFLPIPIGLFLLILSLFFLLKNSYKKAKLFLVFSFVWFVLISNQIVSNALLSPLENYYPALIDTPKVNYILVLGNAHKSDENLPISSQVKETAINRLVDGIRHYNNLKNNQYSVKLIVSGYSFDDINSHAQMQKKLAISLGVDENDIITLDTPKDTKDEAIETKKIVIDDEIILVTSASHMKRAVLLFEKEGLNVFPSPTQHKGYSTIYPTSFFDANNIKKVELAFHEYLGMIYYYLKGDI
ncbi:YdcF family protein [Aliarcobacter vitoriensis]|uniref:YdcF family protein n=1 Tax=Aliarcobacter vitoriensis TaxID=2011099 RepID=UPI003AAABF5A